MILGRKESIVNVPIPMGEPAGPRNRLWVVWLLYFVQFLSVGAYFIYLNVYYREAGLSGTQIGFITMANAIIGMFSAIIWGYFSDRTGKPRLLIVFGSLGSLVAAQFVPMVTGFWGFFALSCLASLLTSSFGTLLDGMTLAMLGSKSENYGRYRLGGSIGFIVATSTAGFIYDATGLKSMFPIYAVIMALFAGIALLLPHIPVPKRVRVKSELGPMLRQPAWMIFAVCVFLVWAANYAAILYLNVSLSSLGANQALIGIANTAGALAELPFMAFSGWFIHRYGLQRLMTVAIILMVARYFLLGRITNPGWAIAINIINGPAYAFYATTAVAYARRLAPPSLAVTSQGLYNATMSFSGVVTSLATGILLDRIGPNGIFTVMGFSCLAALVLFVFGAARMRPVAAME